MGNAAITLKAGTKGYRMRGLSAHAVNFARGVLIGAIAVMSLWLLFG